MAVESEETETKYSTTVVYVSLVIGTNRYKQGGAVTGVTGPSGVGDSFSSRLLLEFQSIQCQSLRKMWMAWRSQTWPRCALHVQQVLGGDEDRTRSAAVGLHGSS